MWKWDSRLISRDTVSTIYERLMILDWAEYLSNWEISPGGTTLYVLYADVPLNQYRARYFRWWYGPWDDHTPPPPPRPQGNNTVRSFSSYFAVTFASSHPILQLKTGFMPGLTRLTIKWISVRRMFHKTCRGMAGRKTVDLNVIVR